MSTFVGSNDQKNVFKPTTHAIVGAWSGFCVRGLLQPLDVIKIRFQLQVEPTYGKSAGLYRGILQSARSIIEKEGTRALWKGHIPAQALSVLYGAGQFWSYSVLMQGANDYGIDSGRSQLICGSLAGAFGTIVAMPCDVARTRLVAQKINKYNGMYEVMRQIIKNEGVTKMWRGVIPALAMNMPYTAINFRCYSFVHDIMTKLYYKDKVLNGAFISCAAISGTIAGIVSKIAVYPLDVLKKRRQISGAESTRSGLGKVIYYKSTTDIIMKISRVEGLTGWFKGFWPGLVKSGAVSGLMFTIYESTCKLILLYSNNS